MYLQNHPLNDGEFDDGDFDKLKEKLTKTGLSISTFSFSFSSGDAGVAVFGDYSDDQELIVIAFNQESCPNGNLMDLTEENLDSMNIS